MVSLVSHWTSQTRADALPTRRGGLRLMNRILSAEPNSLSTVVVNRSCPQSLLRSAVSWDPWTSGNGEILPIGVHFLYLIVPSTHSCIIWHVLLTFALACRPFESYAIQACPTFKILPTCGSSSESILCGRPSHALMMGIHVRTSSFVHCVRSPTSRIPSRAKWPITSGSPPCI